MGGESSASTFRILSVRKMSNVFVFQTFVNDLRIPDQTYITLKLSDVIRFGYDILFKYCQIEITTIWCFFFSFEGLKCSCKLTINSYAEAGSPFTRSFIV